MNDNTNDLPGLARALRTGEMALESLLLALEERMARSEPEIQALLPEPGRFDRLRRQARVLAEAYPDPAARGPLYGVPVAVKDLFHVTGMQTRAGSRLPPEELAGPQGSLVDRLLAAGALVLGKTHTTEFAYFAPSPTKNPRDPDHTPGGSSSGSAAAVAAGYCPLGLGTQTVGSVIRPAAFCGVVGFKPSQGRTPGDGLVDFSKSVDQIGFFTTSVDGAVLAAEVLCPDWDAKAAALGRPGPRDQGKSGRTRVPDSPTEPGGERAPGRLAVPVGPLFDHVDVRAQAEFSRTLDRLRRAGWTVEPVPVLADLERVRALHGALTAAEMAQAHAAWFDRHRALYSPQTRSLIEEGRAVAPATIRAALESMAGVRAALCEALARSGHEAFVCPATPGIAPWGLDTTGDPVMNLPWTHAGLPVVTLPAGQGRGLPLGLQVAGPFGGDEALAGLCARLEAGPLFFGPEE